MLAWPAAISEATVGSNPCGGCREMPTPCCHGGPEGGVVDKLNYDTARVCTHGRPTVAIKQHARWWHGLQLSVKPLWGQIHALGAEKCLPRCTGGGRGRLHTTPLMSAPTGGHQFPSDATHGIVIDQTMCEAAWGSNPCGELSAEIYQEWVQVCKFGDTRATPGTGCPRATRAHEV